MKKSLKRDNIIKNDSKLEVMMEDHLLCYTILLCKPMTAAITYRTKGWVEEKSQTLLHPLCTIDSLISGTFLVLEVSSESTWRSK